MSKTGFKKAIKGKKLYVWTVINKDCFAHVQVSHARFLESIEEFGDNVRIVARVSGHSVFVG